MYVGRKMQSAEKDLLALLVLHLWSVHQRFTTGADQEGEAWRLKGSKDPAFRISVAGIAADINPGTG